MDVQAFHAGILGARPPCQARQWHTRPAAQATMRPASEQAVTRPASEQAVMRPASKQAESLIARRQTLAAWATSVSILLFPRAAQAEDCKLSSAPSGLQFCDLKVGDGSEAQAGTLIRAHYAGRLESSGKQFDSSYDRGRPLTFKVGSGEVIKGWDQGIAGGEGVPAMKAGGRRRLVIPPELGYGSRGAGGGIIPPNASLVFDVQYLGAASARR